jgi:hypothetical protein
MRHPAVLAIACAMCCLAPAAASAEPGFHDRFDVTTVAEHFCGTDAAVVVRDVLVSNGHVTDTSLTLAFNETFTFTSGDRSATAHFAGHQSFTLVEGDSLFSNPHEELSISNGLRSQIKVPGGGVVLADVGTFRVITSFDANGDVVDVQVLKDAGHHEQFASSAFCDAMLPLLGIAPPS